MPLSYNKSKKQGKQGGVGRRVGQKRVRKYFERDGVTKEPSLNRWVRNLHVTNELLDSNQFNDDNIKVIRNYDHGDTTI